MDTPKPKPPVKKQTPVPSKDERKVVKRDKKPVEKKDYELQPHLTHKPFRKFNHVLATFKKG